MTQEEYNVAKQRDRKLYSKIEVLNYRFQVVGDLEGVVIGTPSFSNDSNSGIRRTCNIQIIPKDYTFDITQSGKIWMDKYIKVYIGILNNMTNEIVYTNMGIYLVDNPSHTYSATDNTISISGVDLMARLTGMRDGTLGLAGTTIQQDTNIRSLVIDTIGLFGFNRYVIDDMTDIEKNTQYDINVDASGSAFDIINQILEMLAFWQAYFDVDGVFHFERIPMGDNEQIMVNDDLWKDTLISYNADYDFENVKNYIEVFGGCHDSAIATSDTRIDGNKYIVNASDITDLVDGLIFSFTTTSVLSEPKINIYVYDSKNIEDGEVVYKPTGTKDIKIEDGTYPKLEEHTYYVIKYDEAKDYYEFLGSDQPYAVTYDDNEKSPFYYKGTVGTVKIVLSGGEYDNIYSDYLAKQRADFELYQRCRLQDSISITCVPIYWLDTNWVVEITLEDKQTNKKETNKYIIKSISTSYGVTATQQVTMMRYYPYYNK